MMKSLWDRWGNEVFVPEGEVETWKDQGYRDKKPHVEPDPMVDRKRRARREAIVAAKARGLVSGTNEWQAFVAEGMVAIMSGGRLDVED